MRSLARWAALSLLAAPVGAWALSLGEIDVRSNLNQPFLAEIALSGTSEELQSLNIALASPETFARYGLDRPAVLGTFVFRVNTNAAGRAVVTITSSQSVTEPFMELLVEASSRSGRFLHQYTVFLDPPTFLSENAAPAIVEPPQTRAPQPSVAGGPVTRSEPPSRAEPPPPEPAVVTPEPAVTAAEPLSTESRESESRATETPATETPVTETPTTETQRGPLPSAGTGGMYGPVQNGETLWGIASRMRGDGISMNQMMVAIFEANPEAFDSNMNILRRGAILRIPERAEAERIDTRAATAEFQRQTDAWQGARSAQAPRLVLVPPSTDSEAGVASSSTRPSDAIAEAASGGEAAEPGDELGASPTDLEDDNSRLLEVESSDLRALQEQVSAGTETAAEVEAPAAVDPGVELESEALFADEVDTAVEAGAEEADPAVAETEAVAPPVTEAVPTPVTTAPSGPSLLDQVLGWLAAPVVWIAVGGVAVLLALLLFLRRRRTEVEDVTGQWEALEAEVDDDAREATTRMRRQARDEDFLVQEQPAEAEESPLEEEAPAVAAPARASRAKAAAPEARGRQPEAEVPEPTLSSQTVINLDQADPIAEADFHMAYGLYDQAADLVTKALKAKPDSRELKLKLLEVFFVWGNKDAFLKTAEGLRKEMGARPDADWDKVIIMGKQICPDESLFAAATAAAGAVDVDLDAGAAPALDLAFDAEETPGGGIDLDLGLDGDAELDLDTTGKRTGLHRKAPEPESDSDEGALLDIGERTQQGLEDALLQLDQQASETTPDLDVDSLAVTQESPTVETPRGKSKDPDWGVITMESPTVEASVQRTATVAKPTLDDGELPTVETPTIESTFGAKRGKTASDEGAHSSDYTAELNLDDLGLDVTDIEGLPHDLGALPSADEAESDTRQQPRVGVESDLLSATGVTEVLLEDDTALEHLQTAVLGDDEATMLAPGLERDRLSNTDIIEGGVEEVGSAGEDEALDLNLDDFSAALKGSDTVEQPRTASFERGIFAGGETPIDMDVGADVRGDDEPTGTEEVSPIDPQTMTEVGTKLDLARAYIDMGDPEGARSILEEVLDEGDAGQRREAQSLINALPA